MTEGWTDYGEGERKVCGDRGRLQVPVGGFIREGLPSERVPPLRSNLHAVSEMPARPQRCWWHRSERAILQLLLSSTECSWRGVCSGAEARCQKVSKKVSKKVLLDSPDLVAHSTLSLRREKAAGPAWPNESWLSGVNWHASWCGRTRLVRPCRSPVPLQLEPWKRRLPQDVPRRCPQRCGAEGAGPAGCTGHDIRWGSFRCWVAYKRGDCRGRWPW